MRESFFRRRFARRPYVRAFGTTLAVLWAVAVLGQDISRRGDDQPDAGVPYPRLPGAVTKAPDWIGTDAPFDVAHYFAAVPPNRNAAPLYLDALFEFGSEVSGCFPAGPERDRRRQVAEDRMRQYMDLNRAIEKDRNAVPAERIDAVIKLYDMGFRKLANAQRRDRCVFEIAVGGDAAIFHAQGARQVARIASFRVRRAVERQDFDAAILDVEAVLRLARDLRPRGYMINQLVAVAMTQVVCIDMIKMILPDPGLGVEHCDRLLKVLLSHEASAGDGYAEGFRAEYLLNRAELRKLVGKQPLLATRYSPDEVARVVGEMNHYYLTVLGLDSTPYAGRVETIADLKITKGDDPLSRAVEMLKPSIIESFVSATGRSVATLRATECQIIMRRWQLTHRGLPRALAVAAKEAGLKAVPTDPYDGKSMRVAMLESPPVVYSVGRDGRDDGGQVDSRYDTRPGDLIYRMPVAETRPYFPEPK